MYIRTCNRGLASLFILGDSDVLRVGGLVEKIYPGGSERYHVIEYWRGCSEVVVIDTSKICPVTSQQVKLPVLSVFSGDIVPVPEVVTPKLPDEVAR